MNVPGTWPPAPIRGVLIAPARAAALEEIVQPRSLAPFLRGIGYRLDVDARAALAGNKDDLLADLDAALRKRFEAAFSLLLREPWDFFQLHVSETDRLNHFLWDDYERDAPGYGRAFLALYRRLDEYIGELVDLLPPGADLLLLSGNGFTRLRREVHINRALEELGWLEFLPGQGRRLGATSVGYKKAMLSLKVRPQITPDGSVILSLEVNKDSVNSRISTNYGVAIDAKHVKTEVLVENGGTVVIGGIYIQVERNSVTRVRFLGDLPYVVFLFRNTEKSENREELLVFITPKVVSDKLSLR